MNNARIWCVVRPTVGMPLFFGGIALTSLAVHTAVLTNVGWFSQFFNGQQLTATAVIEPATTSNAVVLFDGTQTAEATSHNAVVVLPDGRTATVSFDMPATTQAAKDTETSLASAALNAPQ